MRSSAHFASAVLLAAACGPLDGTEDPAQLPEEALTAAPAAGTVVLAVDAAALGAKVGPHDTGTNHRFEQSAFGAWHQGAPDPAVVAQTQEARVGLLRWPGGTDANLFSLARATGPNRGCQVLPFRSQNAAGAWVFDTAPQKSTPYGPAEHMRFVEAVGAKANIQVPFVNASPRDAADYVEYFNAPAGTNPNGGVAWADVRASDGHPAPYGIHLFELGNEPYYAGQRYWMNDTSQSAALDQFIDGEHRQRLNDQPLGKDCDYRTPATSDGSASQVFQIHYPPLKDVALTVDGAAWTRVASLAGHDGTERVFTVDVGTGEVGFGDGAHGRIPPAGAKLRVSYTLDHAGFSEFVAAMKRVDPTIDVCSSWGRPEFAAGMARRGQRFDCAIAHPYTIFQRSAGTTAELWNVHMGGEEDEGAKLRELVAAVNKTPGRPYVAASEFGAIGEQTLLTDWAATQMHAIYMASVLARGLHQRLGYTQGGTLTAAGSRSVLSSFGDALVPSAHARILETLGAMLERGGHHVRANLMNNVSEGPAASPFAALLATATIDETGALNVFAVNRSRTNRYRLKVDASHFSGKGDGTAWRVNSVDGSPFAVNTPDHPDAVVITKTHTRPDNQLTFAVDAHSVLWLRLTP
ncbi:MAG: hypothetical protein K1X89_04620 [Myxococcaceae bacterium]|nr:hypothetical protein [Myxococcaceae bacterium]